MFKELKNSIYNQGLKYARTHPQVALAPLTAQLVRAGEVD